MPTFAVPNFSEVSWHRTKKPAVYQLCQAVFRKQSPNFFRLSQIAIAESEQLESKVVQVIAAAFAQAQSRTWGQYVAVCLNNGQPQYLSLQTDWVIPMHQIAQSFGLGQIPSMTWVEYSDGRALPSDVLVLAPGEFCWFQINRDNKLIPVSLVQIPYVGR